MKLPVYLDNHATTKADPRAVEAMLPFFSDYYGNAASSAHPYGWQAREAVDTARAQIAALITAEPGEVVFTSGATEAINLVLKGIARTKSWQDVHIVTCVTEHSAVLDTCTFLESLGATITRLGVLPDGHLELKKLEQALDNGADLVSLMHGNNEIGTIHPISDIGKICQRFKVPLHVDAAQTFGKLPIDFSAGHIDFLSISGHKLYAPKGIGCLFIKRRNPPLRLTPLIHGGGHERGFRSGTLNVPGIIAMGEAAKICHGEMEKESAHLLMLRTHLYKSLSTRIGDLVVNGDMDERLQGNLNISIPGIEGQHLLPALRDYISVSSGSACTSTSPKPSHVLAAIGRPDELGQSSVRFGIGRFNTMEEIDFAAETVARVVLKLRQ